MASFDGKYRVKTQMTSLMSLPIKWSVLRSVSSISDINDYKWEWILVICSRSKISKVFVWEKTDVEYKGESFSSHVQM